ncbi:MAG: 2-succinyl-6-hydroxy-2,4-cyclohexadiene-1-carboxylate synthase [Myxococcales bacterium]|nr:2-succinyl-6-hydroxy-2,4-cyclohexadiene-1-carboxylate synthase [Myxococcales bacterium]
MTSAMDMVALHGFTGSGADFDILRHHAPEWSWCTPDLPGHGRHPAAISADATMNVAVSLVHRVADDGSQVPVLMGYSMGGRVALQAAVCHPDSWRALILVGATPGIADPQQAADRRASDEQLAQKIELHGPRPFLDEWSQLPLIASQRSIPQPWRDQREQRQRQLRGDGLAASLRGMGTGSMPAIWDRLSGISMPVLLVTGEYDEKFRTIADEMVRQLPRATHVVLPEVGHAACLESPVAFLAATRSFLHTHGIAV